MPSFDVVSEVDAHELRNAIDQANREVDNRFDFKGVGARFEMDNNTINVIAREEFQLHQMLDILRLKLAKRSIDVGCLAEGPVVVTGSTAKMPLEVRQGIDTPLAKKIVRLIKDQKMKVQAAIQGNQVRVTGKKRDDLQAVISLLKEAELGLPLQYTNFRD